MSEKKSIKRIAILLLILAIALLVTILPFYFIAVVNSINLTVKQLRLNKKFIGWLDLILLLGCVISTIITFIVLI